MSYTPPAGNAVNFDLTDTTTPPLGNAVNFTFTGATPPSPPSDTIFGGSIFDNFSAIEQQTISLSGFDVTVEFGTPVLTSSGTVSILPSGFDINVEFGVPVFSAEGVPVLYPQGIDLLVQFGTPVLTGSGVVEVAPTGFDITTEVGSPTFTPGTAEILPAGFDINFQFGTPLVEHFTKLVLSQEVAEVLRQSGRTENLGQIVEEVIRQRTSADVIPSLSQITTETARTRTGADVIPSLSQQAVEVLRTRTNSPPPEIIEVTAYFSGFNFAGQFFDNTNVNPLSQGKIYSYLGGTSTPAVTYKDPAGLEQHTNPIILSDGGRTPGMVWALNNDFYKFILKDKFDETLRVYDNIPNIEVTTSYTIIPEYEPFNASLSQMCIEVLRRETIPEEECEPVTLFQDTFTDTNGTLLTAHTIDVAPPGTVWDEISSAIYHNTIQNNRLTGSAEGSSKTLEAICDITPDFPYSVNMIGKKASNYCGFNPYNQSTGAGVLIEMGSDIIAFNISNDEDIFYVEFTVEEEIEYSISVFLEENQVTFSCSPDPISVQGDHNGWNPEPYVEPVIGIFASPNVFDRMLTWVNHNTPYIDSISVIQECP